MASGRSEGNDETVNTLPAQNAEHRPLRTDIAASRDRQDQPDRDRSATGDVARDASSLPMVSVVIPTHHRPELLRRCLAAVLEQAYPSDRFEIIVVEDGGPGEGEH